MTGGTAAAWHRHRVWWPVLGMLALAGLLIANEPGITLETPPAVMSVTLVVTMLITSFVSVLCIRSFLAAGQPVLLLLGCGCLCWGASSCIIVLSGPHGSNVLVTLHNMGIALFAECSLLGALLYPMEWRPRHPELWLTATLSVASALLVSISLATLRGALPPFFINGAGGTPIRQLVLSATIAVLLVAAWQLLRTDRRSPSAFLRWYAPGLALLAISLVCYLEQASLGGPISWCGRLTMYLAELYLLGAALAAVREARGFHISLAAALQNAERLTSTILEQMSDGFAAFDRQWRFQALNPAGERLIRMQDMHLRGRALWDIWPAARESSFGRQVRQSMERSVPLQFEEFFPDPVNRWIECRCQPTSEGLAVFFNDITARKRADEAIQRERDLLQALIDGAADTHLAYLDREFRFLRVNRAYSRGSGFTAADLIGRNHFALFPSPENEAIFRRVRDTGEPYRVTDKPFTFENDPVRGVTYWDWTLLPVRGDGGVVEGLILSLHETTWRKRAEEQLERKEAQLRIFVEHAPASIAMLDRDMRYLGVSRHWLADYNLGDRDIVGLTHYEVFPDIPERWKAIHRRCLAGAVERAEEDPFDRADGSRTWLRWEIHPWYSAPGTVGGLVIFTEDITARKQADQRRLESEAVLRRTALELARSNRDLEQFAYVASHDLQEPLRMVTAFAGLLRERYHGKLDATADEYLAFTAEGATRMQALIDGLLAYSRVKVPGAEPSPVCLRAALDTALENLKAIVEPAQARITASDLPVLQVDLLQVSQVFQNLIGNAIKYRHPERAPEIHIHAEPLQESGMWRLSVRDNGIGIDPQYATRIFEIFQRLHTREEYEGTGIGLAICKRIVENHGGRIWVESTPGAGSTFFFTIPAGSADRAAAQ